MILKELDPFASTDPMLRAGRAAEEAVAFYLKRRFSTDADLRIFHGVRLERDGDAAQMDHLILQRHGTIIIESKSVTTRVAVNDRDEWTRWYDGRPRGIPSPILQARRQGDFLARYLDQHAERLRGKLLGLVQARFGAMHVGVLVAISDQGIVERRKGVAPEVFKADQIPDKVGELVKEQRRINGLLNIKEDSGGYILRREELDRICTFLLEQHRPSRPGVSSANAPSVCDGPSTQATHPPAAARTGAAPDPGWTCRKCTGHDLRVEYGPYGYYFKCQSCGGNTPLQLTCVSCGTKERARKQGDQFLRECGRCGASRPFFSNPPQGVTSQLAE